MGDSPLVARALLRRLVFKARRRPLFLLACVLGGLYTIKFLFFTMRGTVNVKVKRECMAYIDAEMQKIYALDGRNAQNQAFSQLRPPYPISPLKMTASTAVFLFAYGGEQFVLKRVCLRSDAPSQEQQIALSVDHPNILATFASYVGTCDGQPILWLFAEYLNKRVSIASIGRSEKEIRRIAKDVLEGLRYLHNRNLAHLDLKIANVMATENSNSLRYKIIDFGYARKMEKDYDYMEHIPGKSYGTFPYKPPEIVLKNLHGRKSDIYCLGEICAFLARGEMPFYKKDKQKDMRRWRAFLLSNDELRLGSEFSSEFKQFVKECMRRDPKERPTAQQALEMPWFKENLPDDDSSD